jgi:HEAT repeat protein
MRPKFVIPLLVLGVFAVGSLFLIPRRDATDTQPATATEQADEAAATRPTAATNGPVHGRAQEPVAPGTVEAQATPADDATGDTPEAKHEAYVAARVAELSDLAMNDDRDSLNSILDELTNRDPEIRTAALEAAKQFGSRDAIPKLMDAVQQMEDPREQVAIIEAIEWLRLPSLTEVMQQQSGSGQRGGANTGP